MLKSIIDHDAAEKNTLGFMLIMLLVLSTGLMAEEYADSFENDFGNWTNSATDDRDWERKSGSTGSSYTGPTSAYNGDWYVYTEATGHYNKTFVLESPTFTFGTADIDFYYNMYGNNMGTLYLEIAASPYNSWTQVWSLSGNQGEGWNNADIDLSSYAGTDKKLRFRGVTGTNYQSDMALDYITINYSNTPMSFESSTTETASTDPVFKGFTENPIVRLKVVTTGTSSAFDATSISFNTNGTTNTSDITNAKVFYTTSTTFSNSTQFGSTNGTPSGSITFTGTQTLAEGNNYFWLTYDIPEAATENNVVDGECSSVTVDGSARTPTTQAPAGSRTIKDISDYRPTVTTTTASSITTNSASSGGNVTAAVDGGAAVTARGVCWSRFSSVSINDPHTTDGTGTGSFTSSITGLDENTTYYYRAYATNSYGTSYGNELSFTTSSSPAGTSYYVDPNGTDDGDHGSGTGSDAWATIKYAVENVSDPTTATIVINVAAGTYTLNNTYIPISRSFTDLTIDGEGASSTIVQAQSSSGGTGYGFYNTNSTVTIRDLTVRHCKTGIYNRGSSADLTLLNCRITENLVANYSGGGIQNMMGHPSGSASLTMVNCTVDNNYASSSGGGLKTDQTCVAKLTNCTFYGNEAGGGGGIAVYRGDLYLTNCTITGNSTAGSDYNQGGGVQMWNPSGGCDLYIKNTIIANNSCGSYYSGSTDDLYNYESSTAGTIHDGGYNIIEYTDASSSLDGSGNYIGNQDDLWGSENQTTPSLADNDSYFGTQTIALSSGSVAINAGNSSPNNGESVLTYDQRGSNRIGVYDIGAYEYGSDQSLPVELSTFTAENQSGAVLLTWTTESEIENLGFILQKQVQGSDNWILVSDYRKNSALEGHGSTSQRHDYEYTDTQVQSGATYEYRLGDVDYSGSVTWHDPVEITIPVADATIPAEFGLQKVFPNPFNPAVTLQYDLTQDAETTLQVYNMRGQLVETLVSMFQTAGSYDFTWQPQNLSTGVYIVRLQSGNQTNLRKVVFVK